MSAACVYNGATPFRTTRLAGMNDSAHATTAVPWRRVALIVTTAFVVKLVVLMQLWNHPLLQPHGELDTAYYIALGRRIALEGVLAPIGAFFVSPLYVYFLAAVFAAGGSLLAAQLVQIGLGAAAVGMLFATARHWFGERAALVAAGLAILTGVFTFNEVLILQSALDPFLVSCALYALTRTMAGGGTWAFAAAGASLGLLALNRPNAMVFAVAAAAACVRDPVAAHGGGSDRARPAPVVGSGQPRHGAHGIPAHRPRGQRGAQLRRVRGRRLDCVARWAESLHRQPRSRRRDLHARAGHHSIDRGTGRRFDPRGGVECRPTALSRGGLRLFRVAGHRLGHRTSSRRAPADDTQDRNSAEPRRCSTQLQLRVLRARAIVVSPRAGSRSLAATAVWPGRVVMAGATRQPLRVLGLGDVRSGVRSSSGPLLRHGPLPDAACSCPCARRLAQRSSGSSIWCAHAGSSRYWSQPVPCRWPRWWRSRISVSTTGLAASRRARPSGWSSKGRSTRPADSSRRLRTTIVTQASCGSASDRRFSMRGDTRMRLLS